MKSNTTQNLVLNQIFKITKSDENISSYLIDCSFYSDQENKEIPNGTSR